MAKNFTKVRKGITFEQLAGAPDDAVNGDMYYDFSEQKFKKYENGAWSDIGSGGGGSSTAVANALRSTNLNVSNPGTAVYDGVTLTSGSSLFLTGQSTAQENGLWTFDTSSTPLARPSGWMTGQTINESLIIRIDFGGTTYGNTLWAIDDTSVSGTDPMSFNPLGSGGGSGANTSLSNLTTTSINQSLLFNSDANKNIGDFTNTPLNIYTYLLWMKQGGGLVFRDLDASNTISMRAPDTVTTNYIWTLPPNPGTAGYFLQTDGTGTLIWASAAGGGGPFLASTDGSSTNSSFSWASDPDTGMWRGGSGTIIFTSNGSNVAAIAPNAFVPTGGGISLGAAGSPWSNVSADLYNAQNAGDFRFYNVANTFYAGFTADPTLAASYTLQLPTVNGTNGQVLTWNTGSILSWETPTGGGGAGALGTQVRRSGVAGNPGGAFTFTAGDAVYDTAGFIISANTITVDTDGLYLLQMSGSIDSNTANLEFGQGIYLRYKINGVGQDQLVTAFVSSTGPSTTSLNANGSIPLNLVAGDELTFEVITSTGVGYTNTLNYVEVSVTALTGSFDGIAGANKSLSNLITTNINQSLLFDTDAAYDVGSGTNRVNQVHANRIINIPGSLALEAQGGTIDFYVSPSASMTVRSTDSTSAIAMLFYDQDDSHYFGLKAADITTQSVIYSMPAADGTNGQVLTTNGVAGLSWTSSGGSGANTSLSNLITTNINQSFIFNTGAAAFIQTKDDATAATRELTLRSGTGTGFSSGDVNVFSGRSDAATTGNANFGSGDPIGSNLDSGSVNIFSGATGGSGASGEINISTGQTEDADSANITLSVPTPTGAGLRGHIVFDADTQSSNDSQFKLGSLTNRFSEFHSQNIYTPNIYSGSTGNNITLRQADGTGGVQLRFLDGDGSFYSSFQAPQTLAQNVVYKLPTNYASAGQVLTDVAGDGTLSWQTASGGFDPSNVTADLVYGADGTYNIGSSSSSPLRMWSYVFDVRGGGNIRLYDLDQSNFVDIIAADTISSNYSMHLPTAQGAFDTSFLNDGAGNLSWAQNLVSRVQARALSDVNVNISSPGGTHDGVALIANDVIILNNQSTPEDNGPYRYDSAVTPLTRADSWTVIDNFIIGRQIFVMEGTVYGKSQWTLNVIPPSLGTAPVRFTSTGNPINKKENITLSGTDITNQYVDLAYVAKLDSISAFKKGEAMGIEDAAEDYSVDYTGGANGNTRINFGTSWATAGAGELLAGDLLVIKYQHS